MRLCNNQIWHTLCILVATLCYTPVVCAEGVLETQKSAARAEEHNLLAPLIGTWKVRAEFKVSPTTNPEVVIGKARHKWILGKRFVQFDSRIKLLDDTLIGQGILGFDTVKQQFVGSWADNSSTGIIRSLGTYDSKTKTFTFTSTGSDFRQQKELSGRSTIQITDPSTLVIEHYLPDTNGTLYRASKSLYTKSIN